MCGSPCVIMTEVKDSGKAAVWLHPWHGCPWENGESPFCSDKFAYLHVFCTAGEI